MAFNPKRKDYICIFHKAIRKYGKDSFDWEVIYQSKERDHTLRVMEPCFIKEYNSYYQYKNRGYNMTFGGEGMPGLLKTEEHKRKISIAHLGKIFSEETREKMRKANLGKKLSPETRQKMSESRKGNKNSVGRIPWNKGKPHSKEQIQKLRNTWIRRKQNAAK